MTSEKENSSLTHCIQGKDEQQILTTLVPENPRKLNYGQNKLSTPTALTAGIFQQFC